MSQHFVLRTVQVRIAGRPRGGNADQLDASSVHLLIEVELELASELLSHEYTGAEQREAFDGSSEACRVAGGIDDAAWWSRAAEAWASRARAANAIAPSPTTSVSAGLTWPTAASAASATSMSARAALSSGVRAWNSAGGRAPNSVFPRRSRAQGRRRARPREASLRR